jgi:crossover junction endodeoxyribonuclease RusA
MTDKIVDLDERRPTPRAVFPPTRLFIPGTPAPQGSKRHVGHGRMIESSVAVGPWRERVALAVHQEGCPLLDGPVSLDLTFVMPRPKSTPKTRTPPAIKRPDLDKLERAILDALTGIAFRDDAQVVELSANKRLADPGCGPGVWISIYDLTEEPL